MNCRLRRVAFAFVSLLSSASIASDAFADPASALQSEARLVSSADGQFWLGDSSGLQALPVAPNGAPRRIDGIGPVRELLATENGVLALDAERLWHVGKQGQTVVGTEDLRPLQLLSARRDCRCWWLLTGSGLALLQALGDSWSVVALEGVAGGGGRRLLADSGDRLWMLHDQQLLAIDTAALLSGRIKRVEFPLVSPAPAGPSVVAVPAPTAIVSDSPPAFGPAFWRGFGFAALLGALAGAALHYQRKHEHRHRAGRHQAELDQLVQRRTADLEIANRTLRDLADTDALTGVSNRRHFDRLLRENFERALLTGRRMSVLLLDVDHFKAYNDSKGHLAGDAALRALGQTLQQAVRTDTVVARYGGEEFAVITPVGLKEAAGLAERLRRTVESSCGITISLGVAMFEPASDHDEPALLARADRALYAAKAAGRNRVETDSRNASAEDAITGSPPRARPSARV